MARVDLSGVLSGLQGRVGRLVFKHGKGGLIVGEASRPRGEASGERIRANLLLTAGAKGWAGLSVSQRRGWNEWGRAAGVRANAVGMVAFTRVCWWRRAMGLELATDPPSHVSVGGISGLEVLGGWADARAPRFRVRHGAEDGAGLLVFVEMTPGLHGTGRSAYERELCAVRGLCGESFVAASASPCVVEFSGARFAVEVGWRFGVGVRLVSREGVAGKRWFGEFERAG